MKDQTTPYKSPETIGVDHVSNVRWTVLAILMAFSFMNYFNRVSMSVVGDDLRSAYGLTETQLGTVFSALTLAYTLCMIPGGWFSDRAGGWLALAVMGLGTAGFCALTGLLPWLVPVSQPLAMLSLLWLVRGAMGAFTAPLYPAAGRVVARWIPFRQRARVNALVTGIAMVGIAITYPVFGELTNAVGLTSSFLISSVVTAAIAVIWLLYARDEPRHHPQVNAAEIKLIESDVEPVQREEFETTVIRDEGQGENPFAAGTEKKHPHRGWLTLLRNRSLWILTISYATVGYVEYMVFYWSEYYFKDVLKFTESGGRIAAMVPPLCMGICMPLGGLLSDRLVPVIGYRLGRAVVAGAGMVGCAAMLAMATVVQQDVVIVACFALALAFMGITEAPAWATAIELGGRSSASSASIANTGGNLGGTISQTATPLVSAILASFGMNQSESWSWAMRLACLICLVGAILWVGIDASERS